MVERFNQTLQTIVVKFCASKKDNWDMVLDGCIFAYNTSCQESALYTPFEIMFGRKATLPIDLKMEQVEAVVDHGLFFQDNVLDIEEITKQRCSVVKQVKENIEKAQIKQKQNYDRRHANPKAYQIGTKVLKKDFTRIVVVERDAIVVNHVSARKAEQHAQFFVTFCTHVRIAKILLTPKTFY